MKDSIKRFKESDFAPNGDYPAGSLSPGMVILLKDELLFYIDDVVFEFKDEADETESDENTIVEISQGSLINEKGQIGQQSIYGIPGTAKFIAFSLTRLKPPTDDRQN